MKQILFGLLFGILMIPAIFSGAMAEEPESAKIEGPGPFTCHGPNGEFLEPKYAIIEGAYFNNLPADREDCYATIDRGIALCEENTRFEAEHDNQNYAGCLPIFEKRARECAESFREQRYKCDVGSVASGGDGGSGPGGESTNAQAAEDALGLSGEQRLQIQEILAAEGFDPGGAGGAFGPRTRAAIREWQAAAGAQATGYLTEQQTRALLEGEAEADESASGAGALEGKGNWGLKSEDRVSYTCTESGDSSAVVTWAGRCVGGVPDGEGVARNAEFEASGSIAEGKAVGRWVQRIADGRVEVGSYVDGKKNGRWETTYPDGLVLPSCYRAGERVDC